MSILTDKNERTFLMSVEVYPIGQQKSIRGKLMWSAT